VRCALHFEAASCPTRLSDVGATGAPMPSYAVPLRS
jgi:hypothetical protein